MKIYDASAPEAAAALRELDARRSASTEDAARVAREHIAGVRARGDAFVAEQVARFDGVTLDPSRILTTPDATTIASETAQAIDLAIERVRAFHECQLPDPYVWKDGDMEVRHDVRPLARVGVYVPGGRAVYVSTLVMCAAPARIAGVREIVVATTPAAAARPELQYACARLGIREVYRAGGAAGVAALALGTASVRRVDKIVGPGNAFVTAAKAQLVGEVGIDMTAGPTELVVIADDAASADLIVADLLAQAEHGPDSAVILLTTSARVAASVADAFTSRRTGGGPGLALVTSSLDEALAIADSIAPEHLALQTRTDAALAARAQNAGAIYCGPWSPPAAGDYTAGTNHVLPTSGSARFFSPLGVYDFVKRTNIVTIGERSLGAFGPAAATLARVEGLPQHAASVEARRAMEGARR